MISIRRMTIFWPAAESILTGLKRVPGGKTFFWQGVYSQDMNDRTTLRTDLNVFADFQPKLPESYKSAEYLLLGNIQPALQRSVREQMNRSRLVGGDTMNYWINDFRDELLETLKGWDFLLINDSEARLLSGESNLKRAAAQDSGDGPEHAGHQARRVWRHAIPGRPVFHRAWISARGGVRSDRRGRLFRGRLHRIAGGLRLRPEGSPTSTGRNWLAR